MNKALGLTALVGLIGCADFHTNIPVEWYILTPGKSVEISDIGRDVVIKYDVPESGDRERDDVISLTYYETFCLPHNVEQRIGGSGRFYAFGMLFEYTVENDNDGDPANNVLGFSARRW